MFESPLLYVFMRHLTSISKPIWPASRSRKLNKRKIAGNWLVPCNRFTGDWTSHSQSSSHEGLQRYLHLLNVSNTSVRTPLTDTIMLLLKHTNTPASTSNLCIDGTPPSPQKLRGILQHLEQHKVYIATYRPKR
jgi:hypothetical protein